MSTRSLRRLTLLLLLAGVAAYPQGLPLIAVLPLRAPEGLSAEEADAVARLLDTGLVKSSAYQVVEASEISAQKFSSEAISDESSAVRLARILEVATVRTLKAEYEEADTLGVIAQRAENVGRCPSFAVLGGSGAVAGTALRMELPDLNWIPATMAGPAPGPPPDSTPADPALGSEEHLRVIR
jgi:hypothetical protein